MVFGKGINDMNSRVSSYVTWHSMIRRCYSEVYQKSKPTYKKVTVDPDWHYLSSFHSWFVENNIEGWQLDKDLLSNFGNHYSSSNCCFLPNEINCALKFNNGKNDLPPGVSYNNDIHKKKYVAQYSRNDEQGNRKSIHLIYSGDIEECFAAYKQAKEMYIKELAEKYKDILIPSAYSALMSLEVPR